MWGHCDEAEVLVALFERLLLGLLFRLFGLLLIGYSGFHVAVDDECGV